MESLNTISANKTGVSRPGQTGKGLPLWKRLLDLALILMALPALVIFGGVIGLIIFCGSRGPILFRQRRVGLNSKEFVCFKFRTMHVNAETDSHKGHTTQLIKSGGVMTKLDTKRDPRLIPLGKALRASGLDELPQLLNVLRGEMSIVGPRPCIPYEFEAYDAWQRRRVETVPGLTGLWQVSGKNKTTFNQMVQLDITYAETKSLGLDIKIILKTLPALWQQCKEARSLKQNKEATPSEPANTGIAKAVESYQA